MNNKEKVIRKLVEFCKKAESDETTEERKNTITNTAEELVKLFTIHVVVNSVACEHEEQTMQGDGFTYVVCAKCGIDL